MSGIENAWGNNVAEKVRRLKEKLEGLGVKVVLFDYDDTLVNTRQVFEFYINMYLNSVAANYPLINYRALRDNFEEANRRAYLRKSVHHKEKWDYSLKLLERVCDDIPKGIIQKNRKILSRVFEDVPELHDGALDVLEMFRGAGIRMGLVTHANEEWTERKLEGNGIRHFFEHIVVVDESGPKDSRAWRGAIELFGVDPSQVMIVGDNVIGDMDAGDKAGAGYLLHVGGDTWSVYKEGVLPSGVVTISGIGELLNF